MKTFAPGHITGFFSAVRREDPLETGSKGAGIVIEDGVTVEVTPSDTTRILFEGEETDMEPVERVLEMLDVTAEVEIVSDLPIGCGFGVSGGATLGAAMAANAEFGLDKDGDQIVAAAHVAEVESGTGLGDVVPQSQGGIVTRIEPGAPGLGLFGKVEYEPGISIEYTTFGGLDTSGVLGDSETMERVNTAGEDALDDLIASPGVENLVDVSWGFARETGLVTQKVEEEVSRIRDLGSSDSDNEMAPSASMAMLGETVFAVGVEDQLENSTGISEDGARLLD